MLVESLSDGTPALSDVLNECFITWVTNDRIIDKALVAFGFRQGRVGLRLTDGAPISLVVALLTTEW